jgi:hypothetical protein
MTQVYPNFNTAGTVGDALNAARAGAFGKRYLIGRNLYYYAADEATLTKSLELDSASAPKVRSEVIDSTENISTTGLIMYLDAGNNISYPGSGSTWFDLSGFGNNATLNNTPTFNSLSKQSYFYFDGTNESITFQWNDALLTTEATAIAWMKRDGYQGFFDIGRSDNYYPWTGDGNLYISVFDANRVFGGLGNSFNKNELHQVAISFAQGTGNYRIYQNTQLSGSATKNSNVYSGVKGFGLSQVLQGRIYAIMIYNRALTQDQIISIYNTYKSRYGL